jgi:ElaB/YqjD/DUF883 family membrane-anchored ribosome-binding protein
MDQRTEPIRQDIDHIRDQMTEKIAAIEDKVKGQVNETVDNVKQAFDIKQQVGAHPWAALGVSVLAGYVLGTLGDSDDSSTQYRADYGKHDQPRYQFAGAEHSKPDTSYSGGGYNSSAYSSSNTGSGYVSSGYSGAPAQSGPAQSSPASYNFSQQQQKGGFLNDLLGQFGGELDTIKTAAISSLVAMVRDSIKDALPQFSQEYERVRQHHDDTPGRESEATLNTLLRQPVSDPATTSGSRDFSNTGSYSSSDYSSSSGPTSESDTNRSSAMSAQDRDLGERSVGTRSFGATETTT